MLPLDNGVRVERDGGPQNKDLMDEEIDVLPPIYSVSLLLSLLVGLETDL